MLLFLSLIFWKFQTVDSISLLSTYKLSDWRSLKVTRWQALVLSPQVTYRIILGKLIPLPGLIFSWDSSPCLAHSHSRGARESMESHGEALAYGIRYNWQALVSAPVPPLLWSEAIDTVSYCSCCGFFHYQHCSYAHMRWWMEEFSVFTHVGDYFIIRQSNLGL